MEFLSHSFTALRGPTGVSQTPTEIIVKLTDRLSPATLLVDRRAAVLSLKGLCRDCKQEVGQIALSSLLKVLESDAEVDVDIGKAVLETLNILCDAEPRENSPESQGLGRKHTEQVLADERTIHTLFSLLSNSNFYVRYTTLQFLSTLLLHQRQVLQRYFLATQGGAASIVRVLDDKHDIIRNEAIGVIQSLVHQSAEVQKILAFEGAFEKLFDIIMREGGVEGGVVVQSALVCVDNLLRFNTSNQSYFRGTSLPSMLCQLLLFPPDLQVDGQVPQNFSLQYWDDQKQANATLVVGIMGILIKWKGSGVIESAMARLFLEMGLASNAPTSLKALALRLLPTKLNIRISELSVTAYMPVPETSGEEWDKMDPTTALDALVQLALYGEYSGVEGDQRSRRSLELRAAAISVFENLARQEEIKREVLQPMLPRDASRSPQLPQLLQALLSPQNSPLDSGVVTSSQLSAMLFSHILRSSAKAKSLALSISLPSSSLGNFAHQGQVFVPADGALPRPLEPDAEEPEPPQGLLQILTENLSLALLRRSRADHSDRELREWDRLVVSHLCLLLQWLWEDPESVRCFLDTGGLGVLVDTINQSSEVDGLVPGLCSFLLGVCYEFNRQPGEINRLAIHPVLNLLGVDTLCGRLARVREDERFSQVSPDSMVLSLPTLGHTRPVLTSYGLGEGEVWFDWAFVDFWKSNSYTIQKALAADPDAPLTGQFAEAAILVASLRDVIHTQAQTISALQQQLSQPLIDSDEIRALRGQVASLTAQLQTCEDRCKEVEKEQEDLLVLLDEVSSKRKKDKQRLREAALEISENERDSDDARNDEIA